MTGAKLHSMYFRPQIFHQQFKVNSSFKAKSMLLLNIFCSQLNFMGQGPFFFPPPPNEGHLQ